jgi:hypothetical protein
MKVSRGTLAVGVVLGRVRRRRRRTSDFRRLLSAVFLCASCGPLTIHGFLYRARRSMSLGFVDPPTMTVLSCEDKKQLPSPRYPSRKPNFYKSLPSDNDMPDIARISGEKEQLTVTKIAELIDVSFVQACMQLAEGYVDILKLMIASIQSAYRQGISSASLIQEISSISQPAAGRALTTEETRLRDMWIQLVYLMLRALSNANQNPPAVLPELDPDIEESYKKIVQIIMRRRALSDEFKGRDLLTATKRLVVGESNDGTLSLLEEAVLLRNLQVMWLTMTVVEEVARCEGEFARMDAQMPPIAGAFE